MIVFLLHLLLLCVDFQKLCLHPLARSLHSNIIPTLSPIPPPPRTPPSPMCDHLKPKRLTFETERSVFFKPRIQPLLLIKIKRPTNLTLIKMKYKFSTPFCPPFKTNFRSDEKCATEPASDFLASQLTNETKCQQSGIKGIL